IVQQHPINWLRCELQRRLFFGGKEIVETLGQRSPQGVLEGLFRQQESKIGLPKFPPVHFTVLHNLSPHSPLIMPTPRPMSPHYASQDLAASITSHLDARMRQTSL